MKHLKPFCIAFLICITTYAQTNNKTVKADAEQYFTYLETQDFDSLLDGMYPKVFETYPKAQLKAGMDQMFNAEGMKIEFLANDITSISDAVNHEDKIFTVVYYSSKMKMTFLTEQSKPEEERAGFLNLMKSSMDAQFGADNVVLDVKTASLIIKMDSNMFAIAEASYDGWKFIGNDDTMKALINTIIPETVRTKLLKE